MALKSVTTLKAAQNPGFLTLTEVQLSNSYPEGGEPCTAAQLGLASVDFAFAQIVNGTEATEKWIGEAWYTPSTAKLHLQDVKTGKELAKETNTEKVKLQVLAFGKARTK